MDEVRSKKDLTSLVELSAAELAKSAVLGDANAEGIEISNQESLTDADFGDLDAISNKMAGEAIAVPGFDPEPTFDPDSVMESPPAEPSNEMLQISINEAGPPVSSQVEAVAETSATNEPSDSNRPPIKAAPVGATQTVKSEPPSPNKHDFTELKAFGEKLAIGKPALEAAPAFSVLMTNNTGQFDEKTIKAIEDSLTSEDFGIRLEDVSIQLSAGKLLVPRISEFAALTLAQKLHDVVDNIDIDLANEIFKSSGDASSSGDDSMLLDTEMFERHLEEVHDIGAEPRNENDLFSTNLPEINEFQITRILSIVMASDVILAEVAENPAGKEFEAATEKLTHELILRAFKLGAHGVLGINFAIRPIEAHRDPESRKVRRAYRLIGTGTAARVRRKS